MSRIHEALRRGSKPVLADLRVVAGASPPVSLEHYPPEQAFVPEQDEQTPQPSPREQQGSRRDDAREGDEIRPIRVAVHPPAAVVSASAQPTAAPVIAANPELKSRLVVGEASDRAVEQYARLAAALHEIQHRSAWLGPGAVDRGLKTLSITSALPREGKTLTAVNLALTLSRSYERRVLLIDAALARPAIHDVLNLPNTSGLAEALAFTDRGLSLHAVSPYLSVLPAGRVTANPDALASDRMRGLLAEVSSQFDWVLLDSPAIRHLPDARVLARLTRAVLLVIGSGSSPAAVIEGALARLGRECIVGTVLNSVEDATLEAAGRYGA